MWNVKSIFGSASKEAWRNAYALLAVLRNRIRDVIPDPNFSIPDPRSRVKKIPDPGSESASKNLSIFNPKNGFSALENMIPDVHPGSGSWHFTHPGSRGIIGTGSRIRIINTSSWSTTLPKKENDFKEGLNHRAPTPSPLPQRVAKTGRNHLNEEINPPPPLQWDRREI
jgi:hypothetical protein